MKEEEKQLKAFHIVIAGFEGGPFKENEIGIEFIVWHFNRASKTF